MFFIGVLYSSWTTAALQSLHADFQQCGRVGKSNGNRPKNNTHTRTSTFS